VTTILTEQTEFTDVLRASPAIAEQISPKPIGPRS
jgi:hypothetical protein